MRILRSLFWCWWKFQKATMYEDTVGVFSLTSSILEHGHRAVLSSEGDTRGSRTCPVGGGPG